MASHSPLPALGESQFLDFSLKRCPDDLYWLPVLLVRSLNNKVGSLNRNTYINRVQDGLVLLFHTQKKEVEGNEAILGPEVISGGVGLEPAFNRKKKIFHVAILRRKYLIMIFPPFLSTSVRLQNVLSYENKHEGVFFVKKAVKIGIF